MITRNRRLAETVLRPWTPVFIHGDLQVDHVFVDGDEVTGILDGPKRPGAMPCSISPRSRSDTQSTTATSSPDMAPTSTATLSAPGGRRRLTNVRWLTEIGGYGPPDDFPEVAALRSQI